ncbi:MAG: hypothetical protein WA210_23315 [Burkholderiaceae bacterium]
MKDRKASAAVRVVHRQDKAAVRRWVEGNGQALLPMLELLEGAQASVGELMNEAAIGMVEQLLVLSAQELAGAKCRGRTGGSVLWHGSQQGRRGQPGGLRRPLRGAGKERQNSQQPKSANRVDPTHTNRPPRKPGRFKHLGRLQWPARVEVAAGDEPPTPEVTAEQMLGTPFVEFILVKGVPPFARLTVER